jgi:hypothetical protein
MARDTPVYLATDAACSGHLKQALRGSGRPRVVVLDSDTLLDTRLGPLDQRDLLRAYRAEREAPLFVGDAALEADWHGIGHSDENAIRALQDALHDCAELRLPVGRTARDFMAIAYTLALLEVCQASSPPLFRLSDRAAFWPSIGDQPPNPDLRNADSWVPIEPSVLEEAASFWAACVRSTPDAINALAATANAGTECATATAAIFNRFPADHSGLTAIDERVLRAVPAEGCTLSALLDATRPPDRDDDPGSTSGRLLRLRHLSAGPSALLRASGPIAYLGQSTEIALAPKGRAVLSGELNALDVLRHDYWVGGVHVDSADTFPWVHTSMSTIARRA